MATSNRHSELGTRSWVVGTEAADEVGAAEELAWVWLVTGCMVLKMKCSLVQPKARDLVMTLFFEQYFVNILLGMFLN